jgi:Xaa-Pro aminopeptidase
MTDISAIRSAVQAEGLDGWLFCNFHHRDSLADSVLRIGRGTTNSRFWFYLVPREGEALRVVHAIEAGILDGLPGRSLVYSSREALEAILAGLAGLRLGAHWSETVSAVSTLDLGTARLLEKSGIILAPADSLIQRLAGVLSPAGIESHEEAARKLYRIVEIVWGRIREAYASRRPLHEREVQAWILDLFREMGMETEHPPIVAAGPDAGDPHFEPGPGKDRQFGEGEVIQLDLWARLSRPDAIYADISWVGIFGPTPPPAAAAAFTVLRAARDRAVSFIRERLAAGEVPSGASVDRAVRAVLIEAGYEGALRHRTGHGIDVEVHGSGANLDSIEFPDPRRLIEGSCFSVEPGLYFPDFGLRTEIDVYMKGGQPVISGASPQAAFLLCGTP